MTTKYFSPAKYFPTEHKMRIIYLSLLLAGAVSAFQVTKVFPKNVKVKQGGTFKVVCTTDYWYEVSV